MERKFIKERLKSIKEFRSYNNATYLCHAYDIIDGRQCYIGKAPRTCKTCNMLRQVRVLQNCIRDWI